MPKSALISPPNGVFGDIVAAHAHPRRHPGHGKVRRREPHEKELGFVAFFVQALKAGYEFEVGEGGLDRKVFTPPFQSVHELYQHPTRAEIGGGVSLAADFLGNLVGVDESGCFREQVFGGGALSAPVGSCHDHPLGRALNHEGYFDRFRVPSGPSMKLHEYQSKQLLERYGVVVPGGDVATNAADAKVIADRFGGKVVVKAQVLMGGRGKAGGVKLFSDSSEAAAFTQELIGKKLVSIQNPAGMIVEKVLVGEQIDISEEYYVSVLTDRAAAQIVVMISKEGGMEIEEVAERNPDAIVRVYVDPAYGLWDYELRAAVRKAGIPKPAQGQMISMVKALVKAYIESDADLIEINPCALTPEGKLMAADAKVSIDENAIFRHKEYADAAEEGAEDPIEAEAARRGIAYVGLGGDIGIIGNGAGLVMCSLDEVNAAGGKPANFLDVGGGAGAERVKSCVDLIMMDTNVRGLLINIFGGITRGDEVAKGILAAFDELNVTIPVVVRIDGTAKEEALEILAGSDKLVGASTMQEAARKIVELAYR